MATAFLGCLIFMSAGCGSTRHGAAATTATQQKQPQTSSCVSEQQPGIVADFGHRSNVAGANALLARAEGVGFKGLVVQRRGCNDYAVVFNGLSNMHQAIGLQREARGAGLKVTLDCRSEPFRGDIVAVFGRARTSRGARQIAARAAQVGFRRLEVVQVGCKEWDVLLHGLTSASQRRDLAAEARRVGFHLRYEPG